MNIRIVGKNSEILDLSPDWKLSLAELKTRNMAEQAVYLDGAQNVGTNRYDSITLKLESGLYKYISGSIDRFRTPEDYFSYIMAFLREKSPFKIYEIGFGRDARFIADCWLGSGRGETIRRADLAKSISLDIIALDPFWQEPATQFTATVANMGTFSVANAGDYEAYPIIEMTAAADNQNLKLINLSDQNRRFELAYPFFLSGNTAKIDSFNNNVIMNDLNITEFSNGNFIRLLSGVNNFKYIGNQIDIKINWNVRRAY